MLTIRLIKSTQFFTFFHAQLAWAFFTSFGHIYNILLWKSSPLFWEALDNLFHQLCMLLIEESFELTGKALAFKATKHYLFLYLKWCNRKKKKKQIRACLSFSLSLATAFESKQRKGLLLIHHVISICMWPLSSWRMFNWQTLLWLPMADSNFCPNTI